MVKLTAQVKNTLIGWVDSTLAPRRVNNHNGVEAGLFVAIKKDNEKVGR
jgi:hypothetical protein